MSARGTCPGCGAELVFRVDTSLLAVCGYCRSIVARGGADLTLVGKSNEVLVTGSPLALGVEGTYRKRRFTIVGRTQLAHERGGRWDEWLVVLDDGRWMWLTEHQGRYAIMGEAHVGDAPGIRTLDDAAPGRPFLTPAGELVVAERGVATVAAEEGELPRKTPPGARRTFVDLSGRTGQAATLELGTVHDDGTTEPRRFFIGREVRLDELGIGAAAAAAAASDERALPVASGASALRCTKCGAPVEKKRDDTLSLSCASCGSMLSIEDDGGLRVLFEQASLRFTPGVRLGARATLDEGFFRRARVLGAKTRPWPVGARVEVVAHVVRSVVVDGETYSFQEHLLYAADHGYFWLIETDGTWYLARPVETGAVVESGMTAQLDGTSFVHDQATAPRVEQVTGELYWRVRLGDRSQMTDYKSAPRLLSVERTADEVHWTECLQVDRGDIGRVFGVPAPSSVGGESAAAFSDQTTVSGFVVVAVLLVVFVAIFALATNLNDHGAHYRAGGSSARYGGGGYSFGK